MSLNNNKISDVTKAIVKNLHVKKNIDEEIWGNQFQKKKLLSENDFNVPIVTKANPPANKKKPPVKKSFWKTYFKIWAVVNLFALTLISFFIFFLVTVFLNKNHNINKITNTKILKPSYSSTSFNPIKKETPG